MNLPMRNTPPDHGIRVPLQVLQQLVRDLFTQAGMAASDADLMGCILAQTDLRCVYSHGTRQTAGYIRKIQEGCVNPRPEITTVKLSANTVVLDGDGGMGYLPSYRGTEMALGMAKEHGVGVATTRNHFHFGAAGTYSRMALSHDFIGLAISSHRYPMEPDRNILSASGGSPMSIAIPAEKQPPIVLDMSANVMPAGAQEELFERFSAAFMKSLGLGVVFQALGGILAGIWKPEFQAPQSQWKSDQGAFIIMLNIENFRSLDGFLSDMDDFVGKARLMKPMPGMPTSELPGGLEWQWERENRDLGIPISDEHRRTLEEISKGFGIDTPFEQYENTRFSNTG